MWHFPQKNNYLKTKLPFKYGISTIKNLKGLVLRLICILKRNFEVPTILYLGVLESLSFLSILFLPNLPNFIWELKGLDQLPQLTTLYLTCCYGLRKLPDLPSNLRQVCFYKCCKLDNSNMVLLRSFQDLLIAKGDSSFHNHENHKVCN